MNLFLTDVTVIIKTNVWISEYVYQQTIIQNSLIPYKHYSIYKTNIIIWYIVTLEMTLACFLFGPPQDDTYIIITTPHIYPSSSIFFHKILHNE